MSLFLDIGQGAGLAGATGVRPFLPPLLAGALAREDVAIDFDGTDWSFLESPAFLAVVLVLAVMSYAWDRSRSGVEAASDAPRRDPVVLAGGVLGVVLGALLFAGSLAQSSEGSSWIGLIAGPICAVLGWLAVGGLLERARGRLAKNGGAGMLTAFADGAALLLAAIAILLPPLSFLALGGFVLLLVAGRRREDAKYAGLRILR